MATVAIGATDVEDLVEDAAGVEPLVDDFECSWAEVVEWDGIACNTILIAKKRLDVGRAAAQEISVEREGFACFTEADSEVDEIIAVLPWVEESRRGRVESPVLHWHVERCDGVSEAVVAED